MLKPKRITLILICFLFIATAAAQQTPSSADSSWTFNASFLYYFVPNDHNTAGVIGRADHKKLHLEARYNYEDQNTASVFGGRHFNFGDQLNFDVVPMAGVLFGRTNGVAPGLELNISYWKLDFYSETEYVVDFAGSENNYLYTWGELGISPLEQLRTGLTYQRTHLYSSGIDVQKGFFAHYTFSKITAGFYYFNPFSGEDLFIASISVDF